VPIGLGERVRRNTVIMQFERWLHVVGDSLPDCAVQPLIELSNHRFERQPLLVPLVVGNVTIYCGLLLPSLL
jgi:hypothetical protein